MVWKHIIQFLRCGAVACLAVFALAGAEHRGQVKFGGLPLPGAQVTVMQGDKKFTAVTDDQGLYAFPDMADGVWTIQVEMLCFSPIKQEVAVASDAPVAQWEMKLLPFEEIRSTAPPAPPPSAAPVAAPATTPAAGASGTTTQAHAALPTKPDNKRGKGKNAAPVAPTNGQQAFQRADLNASGDGARPPADSSASSPVEVNPSNNDGFLINGSVNNGAASPFAQAAAFGNNRRGFRSLYNGNVGVVLGNSVLDARPYSLTGQLTPKRS